MSLNERKGRMAMTSDNQSKKQTVFKEENGEEKNQLNTEETKTSTGLEPNIAGVLCYLFSFVTGIIFLLIEKENRFVRFHAMQSIVTSVVIFLVVFIINFIPVIGLIISLLISPLTFVLWIFMMYKAYKGEWFKLPIVGDFAENQIDKIAS